jgi:hypothetical protein
VKDEREGFKRDRLLVGVHRMEGCGDNNQGYEKRG